MQAVEFLRSLNCINALAKQGNVAFVRIFGSFGAPNRVHFRVEPSERLPTGAALSQVSLTFDVLLNGVSKNRAGF